jgi:AcrR family transcriptional regulator
MGVDFDSDSCTVAWVDVRLDSRQRSARTKRRRTRESLIRAAQSRFAQLGWQATRVEDVAKDAGVGVATAFSHFSKQSLLAHAYRPIVEPLIERAREDVERARDPLESLTRHVRELAQVGRQHQKLTVSLLAAVQEQTISVGGPPKPDDDSDVRSIVPLPEPMIELIAYGQRTGTFRPTPPSADVGSYHTNALLLRIMTRPHEAASDTADLVLSQMLPALVNVPVPPRVDEPTHGSGDVQPQMLVPRLEVDAGSGVRQVLHNARSH